MPPRPASEAVTSHPGRARLLGQVSLTGPQGTVTIGRPQVQLVLAHLLLERRPTTPGGLADLLWGEQPLGPHWRGAVRGVLSKVRDACEAAGIDAVVAVQGDGTVQVDLPPGFRVDVTEAVEDLDAAQVALDRGRPDEAVALAHRWTELLGQTVLPATDGEWVRWANQWVSDLARRGTTIQARGLIADGHPDRAAAVAAWWLGQHPLDEAVSHLLIEALVADGRRQEAIEAHEELRRRLVAELGLTPAPATTALIAGADEQRDPSPRRGTPRRRSVPAEPEPLDQLLGRDAERAALEEAWRSVTNAGRPTLVLVQGPSGIGKTRLARELAAAVDAPTTGRVVWCTCTPTERRAFEPLAGALTDALVHAGRRPATDLADQLAELVALREEPELARANLFRLVGDALAELAREPLLLVLDDLQWAGADVVGLLEQTLSAVQVPLLVVATGRELPQPVHEALARMARHIPMRTVAVRALEADDLLPLFDDRPGAENPEEAARELHRRTGGNPFFVTQVVAASRRSGAPIDPLAVPDAVREWIGHQLDALPRRQRDLVELAAVLGSSFSVPRLAGAATRSVDDVLDDLEVLAALGFLVESAELDHFSFPHLITQDAVVARIGRTRRARLHGRVGAALAGEAGTHGSAEAATHLAVAGPAHAAEAADLFVLAAEAAFDRGAWSLAEDGFRSAIELLGDQADLDVRAQARATIGLGRALHHQGRLADAERVLDDALRLARRARLAIELAEAALCLVGRAGRGATTRSDAEQCALLEEALRGVTVEPPADEAPEHARRREALAGEVEAELALALALSAPIERRRELVDRSLARAEALEPRDDRLLAHALFGARSVRLDADELDQRVADATRVLDLPAADRGIGATITALVYRHEDLLRRGDRAGARRDLAEATSLAVRYRHPYWGWAVTTWQALGALIDGDLETAEERALAAAGRPGADEAGALACLGVNLVNIRLLQGRSGEVLDLLGQAADDHPEIPCYRAVLALCAVEAGDLGLATQSVDAFRVLGFEAVPQDTNRLLTLAVLADAAVQLGDDDAARAIEPLLAPFEGQHVLLNCYGGGGAYWGPADHQLGRMARLLGRRAEAERLLDQARARAEELGATPMVERLARDGHRPLARPA